MANRAWLSLLEKESWDFIIGASKIITNIPYNEFGNARQIIQSLMPPSGSQFGRQCPSCFAPIWALSQLRPQTQCRLCQVLIKAENLQAALKRGFFWDNPEEYDYEPIRYEELKPELEKAQFFKTKPNRPKQDS